MLSRRRGVLRSGAHMARIRPWERSSDKAFLVVGGGHGGRNDPPPPEVVDQWVTVLSRWGYRSVRTSALAPRVAEVFSTAGFEPAQRLALLEAPMSSIDDPAGRARSTNQSASDPILVSSTPGVLVAPSGVRLGRLARSVLDTDQSSFPGEWSLGPRSLRDAVGATPVSRLFHAHDGGRGATMTGFLLVGVAEKTAYIQRLAVRPERRRSGVASALMRTGIDWARARGCNWSVVNTEVDNAAALSLYRLLGFGESDHGLTVLERTIA